MGEANAPTYTRSLDTVTRDPSFVVSQIGYVECSTRAAPTVVRSDGHFSAGRMTLQRRIS